MLSYEELLNKYNNTVLKENEELKIQIKNIKIKLDKEENFLLIDNNILY